MIKEKDINANVIVGILFGQQNQLCKVGGELDKGCGSCPKCETFYNLTVDEDNKRMILTEWKERDRY